MSAKPFSSHSTYHLRIKAPTNLSALDFLVLAVWEKAHFGCDILWVSSWITTYVQVVPQVQPAHIRDRIPQSKRLTGSSSSGRLLQMFWEQWYLMAPGLPSCRMRRGWYDLWVMATKSRAYQSGRILLSIPTSSRSTWVLLVTRTSRCSISNDFPKHRPIAKTVARSSKQPRPAHFVIARHGLLMKNCIAGSAGRTLLSTTWCLRTSRIRLLCRLDRMMA